MGSRVHRLVWILILVAWVGIGVQFGCGSTTGSDCPAGSENCPCATGGACDPGLTCESEVCIPVVADGGVDGGGDVGSDAGFDAGSGDPGFDAGVSDGGDQTGGDPLVDGGDAGLDGGDPLVDGGDAGLDGGDPVDDGGDAGVDASDASDAGDAGFDGGDEADGGTDDGGPIQEPPSCEGMNGDECNGESCCTTLAVPGGWFAMGRSQSAPCPVGPVEGASCTTTTATCLYQGGTWGCPEDTWIGLGADDQHAQGENDETPEHTARVSGFRLDKFEVTVGRMRAFVSAYDKDTLLDDLLGGAGAHPEIAGSGWQSAWATELPDSREDLESYLECSAASQTWTDSTGANETFPINCLSWYLAYAICAWDGGRLPTEAEWEFVSAGGDQNRLFPWGDASPDSSLANYQGSDNSSLVDVFAKPAGAGRWEHQGLAGSMWEWVLDWHDPAWYANQGADCQDCANLVNGTARTMRGGDWQYPSHNLRACDRFPGTAGAYWPGAGLRCARDP